MKMNVLFLFPDNFPREELPFVKGCLSLYVEDVHQDLTYSCYGQPGD